ncbi:hypothetical protein ED733_003238 [Metarhizium rileyi]|uniref:Uncharacterized protein n=1 Tax=Metarhizium rileyi (strain RCEF 4871) TaxID=1649241 RepID=A0A5C6G5U2_METRR|nr:hypothetical protein ED733_003238 [Metarhizium rileyi]
MNNVVVCQQHFSSRTQFTDRRPRNHWYTLLPGQISDFGQEVAQILYGKHATVWIACHSGTRAIGAIASIRKQHPTSKRTLVFLPLDLVTCRQLLAPLLESTAQSALTDSVRVVWVSSSAVDAFSPSGGVVMDKLDYKADKNTYHKYGVSKAGITSTPPSLPV